MGGPPNTLEPGSPPILGTQMVCTRGRICGGRVGWPDLCVVASMALMRAEPRHLADAGDSAGVRQGEEAALLVHPNPVGLDSAL